jgi:hypothetical protein
MTSPERQFSPDVVRRGRALLASLAKWPDEAVASSPESRPVPMDPELRDFLVEPVTRIVASVLTSAGKPVPADLEAEIRAEFVARTRAP